MRSMRVYSRRVYRNTIIFGAALLAGGVLLAVADIVLLGAAPGWLRTALGFAVAILVFLGGAYILSGLWGLAKAKT